MIYRKSTEVDNRPVVQVKFVEMPGRLGARGAPVRHQEASLFHRAIEAQGGDLAQHVKLPVTVFSNEYTVAEVRNGVVVESNYRLSHEYDGVAFFASREEFGVEAPFTMEYYLTHLRTAVENVLELFPEHRIIATFTTPGTYTAPDTVEEQARLAQAEALFAEYGVAAVKRFANLDVPFNKRARMSLEDTVKMTENTFAFIGDRSIDSTGTRQQLANRRQALGEVFTQMLTEAKPDQVVTTFDIGSNLRLAEMAIQLGIPVKLVHASSQPSTWNGEELRERVSTLLQSDLVEVIGEEQYTPGKRQAAVREINRLATVAGATKVVVHKDNAQRESRWFTNATNVWPTVLAWLKNRDKSGTEQMLAAAAPAPSAAELAF